MDDLAEARRRYRRAWVALLDFMDAGVALNSYLTVRSCFAAEEGGESDLENTRSCLIGFAIVAYMRPFKKSFEHERATQSVTLDELEMKLDEGRRRLHERIEFMRDKLVAHSDFSHKELVPVGPHAAYSDFKPTILQIKEVPHKDFCSLVALATASTKAYMGRLAEKHGDSLMG